MYGEYPERYGATGTPSIVAEREWKSWDSFYGVRTSPASATDPALYRCMSERLPVGANNERTIDSTLGLVRNTYAVCAGS